MTNKQPEALRIADLLGKEIHRTVYVDVLHQNAINELRLLHEARNECERQYQERVEEVIRLMEVNAVLFEALKGLCETLNRNGYATSHADAALAKAQGDNNE